MLAFGAPQEKPAAAVKEKLLARIAEERGQRVVKEASWAGTPRWNWVLVSAAVALATMCLLLSWQNRKLSSQLQAARRAATEFEKERQHVEEMVRVLSAPDTITVKLAGTNEWKQAWGSVKYNGRMGTVMYSAEELPKLPADKIYQMWVVPAGGSPISAGVFAPGANGNGRLWNAQVPANTEPKAFAVTIEPWGGVAQPTGPKVLLGSS